MENSSDSTTVFPQKIRFIRFINVPLFGRERKLINRTFRSNCRVRICDPYIFHKEFNEKKEEDERGRENSISLT